MPRPFYLPLLWLVVVSAMSAPIKIACVGDSITEGAGLSSPTIESYPARLQRLLGTNNFTVRNFGLSGRTLLKKGDFPYWKESIFTNSQTFGPDIVIIQLGTNDAKPQNWRYGTNYVSDYKEMIAIYAALPSAPRIFLCAPCPVFAAGAFEINPGVVRTNIAPAVRALAAELTLPLIDLNVRLTNSTWFPDTVHPNSTGMTAMAAVMYEHLFPNTDEPLPTLEMERQTATRIVLRWPQKWGRLIPQTTAALLNTNTAWTILNATPPVGDGTTIRQTNTVSGATRFFELRRP